MPSRKNCRHEEEFQQSVAQLEEALDPADLDFSEITVRPRKSDVAIHEPGLAWTPWRVDGDGIAEPLFPTGSGTAAG